MCTYIDYNYIFNGVLGTSIPELDEVDVPVAMEAMEALDFDGFEGNTPFSTLSRIITDTDDQAFHTSSETNVSITLGTCIPSLPEHTQRKRTLAKTKNLIIKALVELNFFFVTFKDQSWTTA